jgi:hypothetical protein
MTETTYRYGFRLVGDVREKRRLTNWADAFAAHLQADDHYRPGQERYLSAFAFADDLKAHMAAEGSPKKFNAPCWTPWLPIDLDSDNLDAALTDARRLTLFLIERYRGLPEDGLIVCFSGRKGFSIYLPTGLFDAKPGLIFNRAALTLCRGLAVQAHVTCLDVGIYDKQRLFRSPNSKHAESGLHKIPLTFDELQNLNIDGIKQLAKEPRPWDLPNPLAVDAVAAKDWQDALALSGQEAEGKARCKAETQTHGARLNRQTLDFIKHGADTGDRHRLLFSAAANLAELGCPPNTVLALLEESALDSGLPPSEVRRQVECGIAHAAPMAAATDSPLPMAPEAKQAEGKDSKPSLADLAALWAKTAPSTPTMADVAEDNADHGDAWEPPQDVADFKAGKLQLDFPPSAGGPYQQGF